MKKLISITITLLAIGVGIGYALQSQEQESDILLEAQNGTSFQEIICQCDVSQEDLLTEEDVISIIQDNKDLLKGEKGEKGDVGYSDILVPYWDGTKLSFCTPFSCTDWVDLKGDKGDDGISIMGQKGEKGDKGDMPPGHWEGYCLYGGELRIIDVCGNWGWTAEKEIYIWVSDEGKSGTKWE